MFTNLPETLKDKALSVVAMRIPHQGEHVVEEVTVTVQGCSTPFHGRTLEEAIQRAADDVTG